MNSLLFTFNSQQLPNTVKTIGYEQQHPHETGSSLNDRRQNHLRAFRSKKMKRYEQYIENINLEDYSFEPCNEAKRNGQGCNEEEENGKSSSPKKIESGIGIKPKVLTRNRKFPTDFNLKKGEKPRSMQLIREEIETEQSPLKKKIREEIESIAKRSLTSKDAPKIHFPCSDKKLPKVFRFRSISHQNVGNTSIKEHRYILPFSNSVQKSPPQPSSPNPNMKNRQVYLNLAKLSEKICNSESTKLRPSSKRRKISSFCLNAQETPRFKSKQ